MIDFFSEGPIESTKEPEAPQFFKMEDAFAGIEKHGLEAIAALAKGASCSVVSKQIIEPVIDQISKNCGQEMNPLFLTYCIQHYVNQAKGKS